MKKFDAKSQKSTKSSDEGAKKSKLQPNSKTKYRNYASGKDDDDDEPLDLFAYDDEGYDDDDDDDKDDKD